MLRRLALAGLIGCVALVAAAGPAVAGGGPQGPGGGGSQGGWGGVTCGQNPYPGCGLGAGSSGTQPGGGSSGTPSPSQGSGPDPFFCLDNLVEWQPADAELPPPDGQSFKTGAWYISACSGADLQIETGSNYFPPTWITYGQNPPARITSAQLAQSAYSNLDLPAPTIRLSPAGQQLVNLPTWLAITGWTKTSATAGVPKTIVTPAVSVTATATPTSVVWSTGDGATVTCTGPGTVYSAGDDPASASPTCGHTYRNSSSGQPGAAFTVTATEHWSVTWSGAGQQGAFPDLTTTATVQVPVAESQALTTR